MSKTIVTLQSVSSVMSLILDNIRNLFNKDAIYNYVIPALHVDISSNIRTQIDKINI